MPRSRYAVLTRADVTDAALAMQVQDHSQGEPTFTRPDIGPDIGNATGPFLVQTIRCKVVVQKIGRDVELMNAVRRGLTTTYSDH